MNSGKIRLPTNKTNLRGNILPHDHKEQQQNDQVLSQNTSKGGASNEPQKNKGTTPTREPCILCGNDIKFMERRNYRNRCNNNSKNCIFHDHPDLVGHDWDTKFGSTDIGKAYAALTPKRTWIHGKKKLSHDQKTLVDKVSNDLFTMTNDPHEPILTIKQLH